MRKLRAGSRDVESSPGYHSLVWSLSEPRLLSSRARTVLAESEVIASVANLWELLFKMRKTGALLSDPVSWWLKYVIPNGIPATPIRAAHVVALGRLPEFHKDPFDRILVAQALVEKLPLVSTDSGLAQYGVSIIW